MKTLKFQFLLAATLFAGVAIGYFARPSDAVTPDADEKYAPKKRIAEPRENTDEKALRRRIAKLEKALAEKDVKTETSISNAVAEAAKNAPKRPLGGPREWMESLKKNDPERYTQLTNQFAQWRARRAEQARTKIDFLSSIDTSHMSAGAKKTHDELQELIAKREELEEEMHQEDLSDDQRWQIFDEMRKTDHEIRQLNQQERQNLLEETAKTLGFEGEAARDITETVQGIIEATGGSGHGGFGPPPGGPGPGGPGGR